MTARQNLIRALKAADPNETALSAEAKITAYREELLADRPSRFHATPAEVDAYLRTILAEDTLLRYQWAVGDAAAHEAAEEIRAETSRLKGYGVLEPDLFRPCRDAADQIDPATGGGHYPSVLVDFTPKDSDLLRGRADELEGGAR